MKPTILVVDDEARARIFIGVFLRDNGFEVLEASDGKQALAVLDKNDVQLVISDIRMPGVNGLLLSDIVSSSYPQTPVLLMTGYYPEIRDKLGTQAFLEKPIVLEELLAKTQDLLRPEKKQP